MMGRTRWATALALIALTGGCTEVTFDGDAWSGPWDWEGGGTLGVRGSGVVTTETYAVSDFDHITAWGVGQVIVERTGTERLTVSGDDNVLPYLEIVVENRTLRIGPERGVNLSLRADLVFTVEVSELDMIDASGALELDVTLDRHPELSLTMSGATRYTARGSVDDLDVSASGATSFDGRDLRTERTRLGASGASHLIVWATDRLEGWVSGVSSLRYLGDPNIDVSVSGLATIGRY